MTEDKDDMSRLLAAVADQRDVGAFETLFRHYGPKVKAYLARQTKDGHAAEEIMQETMMTVWNKAALFDPARGSVSSWIFTIARNQFISAYRRQNRPEFDPADPAFVPDAAMSADEVVGQGQDAARLRKAMDRLPPEQMELLTNAFFGEMPHSVLAERFGLPLGTIKSRIRNALVKLRRSLEDGQ